MAERFASVSEDELCEKYIIKQLLKSFLHDIMNNHKNYKFLDCDWFKKLLFPTNSLVKLLSDSLLSDSSIIQSHSKLELKLTNHI